MSNQWQDPYTPPTIDVKETPATPQQNMPTAIKVFGILNLIMAGFGLFGSCAGLASVFVDVGAPNPVLDLMKENDAYYSFTIFSTIFGLLLIVLLAVAGIGLLKNRSWGRVLSVIYAWITIAATLVSTVITYFFLVQPMMEKAAEMPQGPEKFGMQFGSIAGLFGGCFSLIYPVVLLIFMTRPKIVEALRRASSGESGPEPTAS